MISAPFRRPIQGAVAAGDAAAAVPWYVSGGIALANCIGAYRAKGAASYAASKGNLASPGTHDAGDGTAYPTWAAAMGWTFNGSTQYLTTDITPASGWSMFVQIANTTTHGYVAGQYDPTGNADLGFFSNFSNTTYYYNGNQLGISPALPDGGGNLGVAGQTAYRNGVAESGSIGAWSGTPTTIFIGAMHERGSSAAVVPYGGIMTSLAIYNTILTAPQVAALAAAMAAL